MERSNLTKTNVVVVLILLISLFHLFAPLAEEQNGNDDVNMFIHQAVNIAEGTPFGELDFIPNPYLNISPATFPPVFSVIITPVYKYMGIDRGAMKRVVALFMITSVLLAVFAFKERLSTASLGVMVFALGLNPFVWRYTEMIISETTFLFLMLVSLGLIHWTTQKGRSTKERVVAAVLVGISIYLAYGTRSVGIIFVPTVLVADLWANRKITLLSLISIPLFVLFAFAQSRLVGSAEGYSSMFTFSLDAIPHGLYLTTKYIRKFSYLWENSYIQIPTDIISVTFFYFVAVGFINRVRAGVTVFELFVPLYLAIVVVYSAVTPTGSNPRYLIPLVPLYLFYLFYGIEQSKYLAKRAANGRVLAIVAVVICITYAAEISTKDMRSVLPLEDRKETTELFRYINTETSEESIFISRLPRTISLYTSRRGAFHHPAKSNREHWSFFNEIGATHLVVVKNDDSDHIFKFVEQSRDKMKVLYSNDVFVLFDLFPKEV